MMELLCLTWLLSMPACAEVDNAMQELTGVNHNTGEQNKDMTDARQAHDMKDTPPAQIQACAVSRLGSMHTLL
ncbi:unnamed protein product [Merluccius merluccius]